MSNVQFKPEQKSVLDLEGKNQIVSASAGSGKTTVMIQKIINLILEQKKNIKEILVLTYTKAAAEEMKQKLISALYDEAEHSKELIDQIDDVSVADVSTIHSFFQKMIKKYFMALKINPSFVLMDENEEMKLKSKAFDEVLEDFEKTNSEELESLIDVYGKTRNSEVLKKLILEINKFLLALPNSQEWCNNTAAKLYSQISQNEAVKIVNNKIFSITKYFVKQLKQLQQIASQYNEKNYIVYCNTYLSTLELVKEETEFFAQNCTLWENVENPSRVLASKNFPTLTESFKDLQKQIKDFSTEMKKCGYSDVKRTEQELDETKQNVIALCKLANSFQNKYNDLKEKNNVFDFDDLERKMLELVENEETCNEIRNSYYKICVDEYQDANRVQEKILSKIANGSNRFLVGDVKQSIYAFRLAEPDIFLDIQEQYNKNTESEVQFLNCNFRSDKNILDFINSVFNKIMTEETSKINYKKTSMLNGQAEYKEVKNQDLKPVEVVIIQKEEKEKKPAPTKMYSVQDATNADEKLSDAKIEAFYVAKKISELVGKKIYIAKEKCERRISYSDITILLRSRGAYLDDFCSVLTSFNIPLFANTNVSQYVDCDIMLLLNLLKLVVSPNDDIALTSVMHSVFGGFSYNELAKIRLNQNTCRTFCECVNQYENDDEIKSKIIALNKLIDGFAFDCTYLGICKAYSKILLKYDFYSYILLKDDGLEKMESIKKYISDFLVNGYNKDIIGFLRFVEENKDNINAPDYQGGENCVHITTIHSSKGLEYPIVILANANQNFNSTKQNTEIKLNQNLGIGLRHYDKNLRTLNNTLAYSAIKEVNKKNDFAEKLRLLYVALTRAQNHLIIVGTSSKSFEKINTDFDVLHKNSYLQLIIGSLDDVDIDKINENIDVIKEHYKIQILSNKCKFSEERNNSFVGGEPDDKTVKVLEEYFNFQYPYKTNIAIKNSVTSLNQSNEYTSKNYAPKNLDVNEHLIEKTNEIGTAYHAVMEKIDFDKVDSIQYIKDFLQNCKIDNVEKVDAEKIFNAVNIVKKLGVGTKLKEQQFMMYVPHSEVVQDGDDTKILIQGVIDLLILGKQNILVDYKFISATTDKNKIIKKYQTQLLLYQKATEKALGKNIDSIYLLLLNSSELIKVK